MRTSTPTLDAALSGSHARALNLAVRDCETDALVLPDVPIETGLIRQDLGNPLGWSGQITVADPDLLPKAPTDPLSGFAGTYLDVSLGAVTSTGAELIPLARVLPERVALARDSDGAWTFTVDLVTAAAFVSTAWDTVSTAVPGETVQDTIVRLVTDAVPWTVAVVDTTTPVALDPRWTWEGEPWGACRALAEGANLVCEMDANRLWIRPPHTIGPADATWSTTDQVLALETETGRGGGFANRVRVTFDTPDGPVVGDVTQNSGPLAYGGPAGRATLRLDRPGPTDPAAASVFAADLLATTAAAWRTVGLTARPDPRIECGDTLQLNTPSGGSALHLVTYTEWNLGTEPMRLGVRTDADAA